MRFSLASLLIPISSCTAFFVSGPGALKRTQLYSGTSSGRVARDQQTQASSSLEEHQTDRDAILYEDLCHELGMGPENPTYLQTSEAGVRGVHVAQPIAQGEIIMSIPISKCLRDDTSPLAAELTADDPYVADKWASRLAAAFLESRTLPDSTYEMYLKLLPDSELLAGTLPINWRSDLVTFASSTALELYVDSAFFARAQAMEDVLQHKSDYTREDVQYALDIVQTRSCRLTFDNRNVRCLVPVYDMINHSNNPNAEFMLQDGFVVVKALSDMELSDEILIDYGTSARPAARCLASYGFVPDFDPEDESAIAEIYLDGKRYEVGPSSVPEGMVAALTIDDPSHSADEAAILTPEIAVRLARRLSDVSFQLLLDPLEGEQDDETAAGLLSAHLAKSLRWYQHRVLSTCSGGLRDWALEQEKAYSQVV